MTVAGDVPKIVTSTGGHIAKTEVPTAVQSYYHSYYDGDAKQHKSNYAHMVNKNYDLATSFYEYGWGQSFHFGHRLKYESLMTVVDERYKAIYTIEASCHAPGPVSCYSDQIYRVLKPGHLFAGYKWWMTNAYDPKNPEHNIIKAEIELGNGLPVVRTTSQCLQALNAAENSQILLREVALAISRLQGLGIFKECIISLELGPVELPGNNDVLVDVRKPENIYSRDVRVYSKPETRSWTFDESMKRKNLLRDAETWDNTLRYGHDDTNKMSAGLFYPRFKSIPGTIVTRASVFNQDWLKYSSNTEQKV